MNNTTTTREQSTTVNVNPAQLPERLRNLPSWSRLFDVYDEAGKFSYTSSDSPTSFAAAYAALGDGDRLSIMLTLEAGLAVVILEDVLNGELVPWARDLLAELPATFKELSLDGRSVYVWLDGAGEELEVEPPGGGRLVVRRANYYAVVTGRSYGEPCLTIAEYDVQALADESSPNALIPELLKSTHNWVLWGGDKKLPFVAAPGDPVLAKSNDPQTWRSFAEACDVLAGPWGKRYRGLGFVLSSDCGLTCLDLDHVITEDGTLVPWASGLLAQLPVTWCELSPSGRGLHVWLRGSFTGPGRKGKPFPDGSHFEMYCTGHYMTITGRSFGEPCLTIAEFDVQSITDMFDRGDLEPATETFDKADHHGHALDLDAWVARFKVPVLKRTEDADGTVRIETTCIGSHGKHKKNDGRAFIGQRPDGQLFAGCHHESCSFHNVEGAWQRFREHYEPQATRGDAGGQEKLTQVKRLLSFAGEAELFHTPESEGYASLMVNEHVENWPLKGKRFRQWLLGRYYRETRGAPQTQALQEAIGIFESRANFDAPEHPVMVRFAEHGETIYLDLGNEAWEAVAIDKTGWRVVPNPPVKFRRPRGLRPLPAPVDGGNVNELRRFVNVKEGESDGKKKEGESDGESNWVLLLAWLITAFRARGPYPILIIHGGQGSAKTTLARILRELLDPNTVSLRSTPRDLQDLMIAAANGWVISLDNVSRLSYWLSDALCQVSTGGGFATRELYTDTDEILLDVQRPIILNAIEEVATRGDLLDRAVILYLPVIDDENRKSEDELWAEFETAWPRLLGSLLTVVSGALKNLKKVDLKQKPRMLDFARWATAAEKSLNWKEDTFMTAYLENQTSASDLILETSPIASAIQKLTSDKDFEGVEKTATELLDKLSSYASDSDLKSRSWPANGKALSDRLRRIAPSLRTYKIEVTFRKSHGSRVISVKSLASRNEKQDTLHVY
jgi:hypothetical protein